MRDKSRMGQPSSSQSPITRQIDVDLTKTEANIIDLVCGGNPEEFFREALIEKAMKLKEQLAPESEKHEALDKALKAWSELVNTEEDRTSELLPPSNEPAHLFGNPTLQVDAIREAAQQARNVKDSSS